MVHFTHIDFSSLGCCGCPLLGQWQSGGYDPIMPAQSSTANISLGKVLVPNHPILKGITTFNGRQEDSNTRYSPGQLNPQATCIAKWSNGSTLIAEHTKFKGKVVTLNFLPTSSRLSGDAVGWDKNSNGDLVLHNTISYVCKRAIQ